MIDPSRLGFRDIEDFAMMCLKELELVSYQHINYDLVNGKSKPTGIQKFARQFGNYNLNSMKLAGKLPREVLLGALRKIVDLRQSNVLKIGDRKWFAEI
jgi:hypothetical protein